MAKLFFRYGAMNSGKSTALMQVAHNYEERGMRVLLLKPSVDTKGEDRVVSRLGVSRKVDICVAEKLDLLQAVIQNIACCGPLACVLVDESQFLTRAQADQLLQVTVKLDVPVICYGLRTDFNMNGFAGSTRLLEIAHNLEEMKTICACGKKAMFNGRKLNGEYVFEGSQVAIDLKNNVEYQSLCASCYFAEKEKYFKKKQAGC
ncbi:MAG: thymidine kinase [Pygmaiobacter massiliensis]|nr:thymidine kinase [Pygmaiobacter massiliensis]